MNYMPQPQYTQPQQQPRPLEYYDKENNVTLKGFSQVDLDLLHKAVRRLTIIVSILGTLATLYILWLTYYIIHNGVLNNIVHAITVCS